MNYPGLLDRDSEINFALKYRQLIELIGGTQGEMEKYNGEKTDTICNGNINAIKAIGFEKSKVLELNNLNFSSKTAVVRKVAI